MSDIKNTFEIISSLLLYPNEEWMSELPDICSLITSLKDLELKEKINSFVRSVQKKGIIALEQEYIETFDFGNNTNLYITYDKYGEQRERGQALLSLKQLYESEGCEVIEQELPDYLPLVLEFLSVASEENTHKLIYSLGPVIEIISENLNKTKSDYAILMDSLLYIFQKECISYPKRIQEASSHE